ncbi:MAG: hypothetical protein H7145_02735 [Akkermansiaceae bacterium]|nr:hypothetical protein [Armatimonadota bacterium]
MSWYIPARSSSVKIVPPTRPPIPAKNGFPVLKAVSGRVVRGNDIADAGSRKPSREWTLTEKKELVSANRDVIRDAQAAVRLPYYEANTDTSINYDPAYYKRLRSLVTTLTLAADVAWEAGKQAESVGYYLDAVTLSRHILSRVGLLGHIYGLSCEGIAQNHLWRRLPEMNADIMAHCLTRLNALSAERVPFYVALEEEKYSIQRKALEVMEQPEKVRANGARNAITSYANVVPRTYVLDTMGGYMDKLIAQTKRPYIKRGGGIAVPEERYTRMFAPEGATGRWIATVAEMDDALVRTVLALRIYKARKGKFPASLSELVGARLLPAIPNDPFALPGTPLRYKLLRADRYLLYSIGSDGSDDGGKRIERKSTHRQGSKETYEGARGDMLPRWDMF